MKHVHGNLLDLAESGQFDVIVHGANTQCAMKSGIAAQIADRYPEAVAADREGGRDPKKLGTCSTAQIHRDYDRVEFVVVNAYTQAFPYGPQPRVSYEALRLCFRSVATHFPVCRIGYPQIGAGLGGGDWEKIAVIIDEELVGLDHTLVLFDIAAAKEKE